MSILDTIVTRKKEEIAERKKQLRPVELEKSPFFDQETYSLSQALRNANPGILLNLNVNHLPKVLLTIKLM